MRLGGVEPSPGLGAFLPALVVGFGAWVADELQVVEGVSNDGE